MRQGWSASPVWTRASSTWRRPRSTCTRSRSPSSTRRASPGGYTFNASRTSSRSAASPPPFRRRDRRGARTASTIPSGSRTRTSISTPRPARRLPGPRRDGRVRGAGRTSRRASCARDRPLWEIWAVENIEGDQVAFVAKIHHSVADGVAAASLLASVARRAHRQRAGARWHPEPIPKKWELFRDAAKDSAKELARFPKLMRSTVRNMAAVRRKRKEADVAPPLPFDTPTTRFNTALTPHRLFTMASLSLDDVKTVKNAVRRDGERRRPRRHARARSGATSSSAASCRTSRSSPASRCRRPPSPSGSAATRCRTCSPRCAPTSRTRSSAPRDPRRHEGGEGVPQRPRVGDAARLVGDHAAPSVRVVHALVLAPQSRGEAPAPDQPRRVERPRAAVTDVDRRRADHGALLDGADPRGHRAQRDGLELRRLDELRRGVVPRVRADLWALTDALGDELDELRKAAAAS